MASLLSSQPSQKFLLLLVFFFLGLLLGRFSNSCPICREKTECPSQEPRYEEKGGKSELLPQSGKEDCEISYWKRRKKAEGALRIDQTKYFLTYFGLSKGFYKVGLLRSSNCFSDFFLEKEIG